LAKGLAKLRQNVSDLDLPLFLGRNDVKTELFVVFCSERGLCGNFNYVVGKEMAAIVSQLHTDGKNVFILCVGAKALEMIRRSLNDGDRIELVENFYSAPNLEVKSIELAQRIIDSFMSQQVDAVTILFTKYYSVMKRSVEIRQLVPMICEAATSGSDTIFEPNASEIMRYLLPHNIAIQIYQSALESVASEQSSRMTSMDSSTRNADSLLSDFSVKYNRTRQYKITQELMEVISGAEAIARG
jgi:F-type H+-transporting ATPase subunit gamma